MKLQDYIGFPLDYVKNELNKFSIKYKVVENSDIQKNYDTILVVKISQKNDYVEIVTDKFLLNI